MDETSSTAQQLGKTRSLQPGLDMHKQQWRRMPLDTCMMHRRAYAVRGRAVHACGVLCMHALEQRARWGRNMSCMECVVQRPALARADLNQQRVPPLLRAAKLFQMHARRGKVAAGD